MDFTLNRMRKEQTFEAFFRTEMERIHKEEKGYSYKLIHTDKNVIQDHIEDRIVVFKEQDINGEQIFLAYFEKVENRWEWKQTRGAEWGDPINWQFSMQFPYTYIGALDNPEISNVYVGNQLATMLHVEGEKRFWYFITNEEAIQTVKVVREGGTEEVLEEMDEEELKKWKETHNE